MKGNFAKWRRSLLACLLVFTMLLSMSATAIAGTLAATDEPQKINYVSLGDSMSNGYGLPGYDGNSGVQDYGYGSYANLFAEALEEFGAVTHAQLAMSGIRTEDLHWLLELDYEDQETIDLIADLIDNGWDEEKWNATFSTGDYWTLEEICDHSRLDASFGAIYNGADPNTHRSVKVAMVAKFFQECVAEGDIISLGIGNGNFGVYMLGRIMEAIGFNGADPTDALVYNVESAIRELDPGMQESVLALIDQLYVALAEKGIDVEDGGTMEALANTVVYTGVSFILNYMGSVEAILRLNPDAEIILVALMNTFEVSNSLPTGSVEEILNGLTIGDLLKGVFEPLNAFIAAYPAAAQLAQIDLYEEATFYYAEADKVECLCEVYEEELKNPKSVLRKRFVANIVGGGAGMIWGLIGTDPLIEDISLVPITLEDIEEYEGLSAAQQALAFSGNERNKYFSIAFYLAFEKAIVESVESSEATLSSVLGLGNLSPDLFAGVLDEFMNTMFNFIADEDVRNALIKAIAESQGLDGDEAVAWLNGDVTAAESIASDKVYNDSNVQAETGMDAEHLQYLHQNGSYSYVYEYQEALGFEADTFANAQAVEAACPLKPELQNRVDVLNDLADAIDNLIQQAIVELETNVKSKIEEGVALLLALQNMPNSLSAALLSDSNVSGLLGLYARCILGDGVGGHPSAAGHEALFEAVYDAYFGGNTALNETIKNIEYIFSLIEEYYDDAYAYAYEYADKQGLIDEAARALDWYINWAEKAIRAVERAEDEFGYEYPHLIGELVAMIETLEELQAALYNDDMATVPELIETIYALEDNLNHHLYHIYGMLDTLEENVKLQLEIALDELEEKWETEWKPALEELAEAIEAEVDAFINELEEGIREALEELEAALPGILEELFGMATDAAKEAAKALYDYLYNNPDEVIAFFAEYGDDILAIINEYGDEAAAVVLYIAYNYGCDILNFVIENHEEIVAVLTALVEEYGDEAWALIDVYLEALGVYDLIDETIESLEKELEELQAELEALVDELEAELKAELEAKIEAIKAKIEAIKEELEAIEEALAEVDEAIINLFNVIIGAVEDSIYDAIDALENAFDNLEEVIGMAEELFEVIDNVIEGFEELVKAIEENIEMLEDAFDSISEMLSELKAELEAYIEELKAELEAYIEELKAELEAAVEELKAELEEKIEELEAFLEELKAELEEYLAELEAYLEEIIPEIEAEVEEIIAELQFAIQELENALMERIITALYGQYIIDYDSYYVALGDKTAVSLSYVDILGISLGIDYKNLAQEDFSYIGTIDVIKDNIYDIIEADLITLGFSNNHAIEFTLEQILNLALGYELQEYDWAGVYGEEIAAQVETALALIEGLIANGTFGDELVGNEETLLFIVETYAYAYFETIMAQTAALEIIKEVNPEALVLIIGTNNALTALDEIIPESEASISDVIDSFIDISNFNSFMYAFINENTVFIPCDEVETRFDEDVAAGEYDNVNPLTFIYAALMGDLVPSFNGHFEIFEAIVTKLLIMQVGLMGDVNYDGEVDARDAKLILEYEVGNIEEDDLYLFLGDVNGDGEVDARDAKLILDYEVGNIEEFEAA